MAAGANPGHSSRTSSDGSNEKDTSCYVYAGTAHQVNSHLQLAPSLLPARVISGPQIVPARMSKALPASSAPGQSHVALDLQACTASDEASCPENGTGWPPAGSLEQGAQLLAQRNLALRAVQVNSCPQKSHCPSSCCWRTHA